MIDAGLVGLPFVTISGEFSRGEKMTLPGTEPESYITEYTSLYEDERSTFEGGCVPAGADAPARLGQEALPVP